ncbi:hypothetical protein MD484_g7678, partial [Candolleomyces efflorescens]
MALTPSFWSWRVDDYYRGLANATQGIARPLDPEGMILADLSTCVFLSVMTAVLGVTSAKVLKLIFRWARPGSSGPVVRHRPSVFAVGSLLLFLLFAIGTSIYCANTLLSLKEILCMLRNTKSSASKISDGLTQFDYLGGCRTKVVKHSEYADKTEYFLHFMFARIFQVIFLVADGLLVYRCYIIFSSQRNRIYLAAVAIYVVTLAVSVMEMCGFFAYAEGPVQGARDLWTLAPVATTLNDLRYMWLTFSLITNLLSTGLIVHRIVQVCRRPCPSDDDGLDDTSLKWESNNDSRWHSVYAKVVFILIEAMLLPALCGIATIVTWLTGTASSTDSSRWTYHRVLALRMFLTLWVGNGVLAPQLIAIYALKRRQLSMDAQDFGANEPIW